MEQSTLNGPESSARELKVHELRERASDPTPLANGSAPVAAIPVWRGETLGDVGTPIRQRSVPSSASSLTRVDVVDENGIAGEPYTATSARPLARTENLESPLLTGAASLLRRVGGDKSRELRRAPLFVMLTILCAVVVLWYPSQGWWVSVRAYPPAQIPLSPEEADVEERHNWNILVQSVHNYSWRRDYGPLLHKARKEAEPKPPRLSSVARADCTKQLATWLWDTLGPHTSSNTTLVRNLLHGMRLERFEPLAAVTEKLMREPQSLRPLVDRVSDCASQNVMLGSAACRLVNEPELLAGQLGSLSQEALAIAWQELLTWTLVLEAWTQACQSSYVLAHDFAFYLRREFVGGASAATNFGLGWWDASVSEFLHTKFTSIESALSRYNRARANRAPSGLEGTWLTINILEAVSLDAQKGLDDNVVAGLAVAHEVRNRNFTRVAEIDGNQEFRWALGTQFADSYIAWNLNFNLGSLEAWSPLSKLLLPSVVCTRDDFEAETFLSARVYSLFFFMLLQGLPSALRSFRSPPGAFHLLRAGELARALANTTLDTLPLYSPPSAEQVLRMQHDLPGHLSLLSYLGPYGWRLALCTSMWISCLLAGIALELGSRSWLRYRAPDARLLKTSWWLVQTVFPLLQVIGIYSFSVFGLPFMVLGLFKFGMPEISTYLVLSFCIHDERGRPIPWYGVLHLLNGLATLLHHAATLWLVCSLITRTTSLNGIDYLSVSLPLVCQHYFVALRFHAKTLYAAIELVLEIWWEVEVWNVMPRYVRFHEQRVIWAMLCAHWLYWIVGVLEWLLEPSSSAQLPAEDPLHTQSAGAKTHRRNHTLERMRLAASLKGLEGF